MNRSLLVLYIPVLIEYAIKHATRLEKLEKAL